MRGQTLKPKLRLKLSLAALLAATVVQAQDRPREDDMFGAPAATPAPKAAAKKSAAKRAETKLVPTPEPQATPAPLPTELQSESGRDAFASGETSDNPLQIGGTLYQRMLVNFQEETPQADAPLSMPMQFDLYLDARPNDRVRGFVDTRILYDSSKDQYSRSTSGTTMSSLPTIAGSAALVPNNPQTVLDQAWIKFDIDRTVFVTAGKQHIKWGTARFWNPTDFLSTQRRDPLLPYDLRLGDTMAKFELPVEASQMNLYAVALFDNTGPASTLGQLGLALRAEKVVGEAEFGVDLLTRGRRMPVWGVDVSSSLGPFDVYGEAAIHPKAPGPMYKLLAKPTAGADVTTLVGVETKDDPVAQGTIGGNYQFSWKENRIATVGLEYFHNPLGYDNGEIYPVLIFFNAFQPYFVGRDYAGLYVSAEGPDAQKKTSYTFSTLGNLNDKSFYSRLDFRWLTLNYLTFEAFGGVHFGGEGGEFNFEIDTPALTYGATTIPAVKLPRTIYDLGLALRVAF